MEYKIVTETVVCRYHTYDKPTHNFARNITNEHRIRYEQELGSLRAMYEPQPLHNELIIEEPYIETVTTGYENNMWMVRIQADHWAPGIWAGTESARIAYYDRMNQRHTTTVRQVDLHSRELLIDRPELEPPPARHNTSIWNQPVILGHEHGVTWNRGLDTVVNTSGTSLYGINPMSRTDWGNVTATDVTLNLQTLQDGLNQIASRGGRHG